jgi:predicted ATPase
MLVVAFGVDPAAAVLAVSGWRLWLSGCPTQAWCHAERALTHAESFAHPFTIVGILFFVTHVRQFRGEYDAAWALTQRLVSLGREQGFVLYEAVGVLTQGIILVQRGELEHGVALITTGLGQYQRLGAQLMAPFFLAFLAEAYLRQGQVADGLQVINEALRLTATNFDRFWEAELYRLRGELLLAQEGARQSTPGPGAEDAEACVQQALAIARQQGTKALELRAAMSLSRLWQRQGKRGKTRQLLVEVYGGFSEGFDTADLQAAQALLAELEG